MDGITWDMVSDSDSGRESDRRLLDEFESNARDAGEETDSKYPHLGVAKTSCFGIVSAVWTTVSTASFLFWTTPLTIYALRLRLFGSSSLQYELTGKMSPVV